MTFQTLQRYPARRILLSSCRLDAAHSFRRTTRSPVVSFVLQQQQYAPFSVQKRINDEWKSPPNLISLTRIAFTPVLSYFIVTQQYEYALWGCVLAGVSDFCDGYLAKHYDMKTVLGSYLDPLADKLLINTVAVSIWYQPSTLLLLPTPLVALWLGKDLVLVGATTYRIWKHPSSQSSSILEVRPTYISKINTTLQFATLTTCLVHPWMTEATIEPVLYALWYMTGTTTLFTVADYVRTFGMDQKEEESSSSDTK